MAELDRFELFAGCTRHELRSIDALGAEIDVRPGKRLTVEGSAGRECFLVLSGTASVVRDGRSVATIGPGDLCGEIALLTGVARTATVVADRAMRIRVFTPGELHALLAQAPAVAARILDLASHRAHAPARTRPVDVPRLATTSA